MIKKILIMTTFISSSFSSSTGFLEEQKKFERVSMAMIEKEQILRDKLQHQGLTTENLNILIVAYKDESELIIYAKNKTTDTYKELSSYKICKRSGHLGPKRKEGDAQVPEGYYHISRFNPLSNFYLSLGLDYPNDADRKKSTATHLGGDIFIHGDCVTIGCMPMTDDKIKEIYLYAVHAKNNGQSHIPVYVFPFKMTEQNFSTYQAKYKDHQELIAFWKNLKTGYEQFIRTGKELHVKVDAKGDYLY